MTIQLVALDIAGTTVDEGGAVYRLLAEVVRDHEPSDADIRHWMGADKREAIAALLDAPAATVEAVHTEFVERLVAAYAAQPPRPLPGVPAALATLRAAGVLVALTTGFRRPVTEPLLAAVGWTVGEHLDAVVCANEVAAGRPAPDMIREAMRRTGVDDAAAVLAAGDTVLDIRAGLAAGVGMVVGVLTGAQTGPELDGAGATHVIAGVAELPALLGLPSSTRG
ncbi:phosphonatase-like hydrolase [Pseudonocardia sp. TRM90224]|uniref:phosphonatase-like hydrolase n=1 Tax=Pseudonocardia sp. TRM90224 TaxID=2812678 RepID=UPI001E57350E|nr:phosphonatase-like hydrolase [Pseudonocardia sp. TRM90224]